MTDTHTGKVDVEAVDVDAICGEFHALMSRLIAAAQKAGDESAAAVAAYIHDEFITTRAALDGRVSERNFEWAPYPTFRRAHRSLYRWRMSETRTIQERLREVSRDKQSEAWRRLDGGQDLSIGATLADEAAERIDALEKPFDAVMDGDWSALDHLLGHSGAGQFWRGVFKEFRAALHPSDNEVKK